MKSSRISIVQQNPIYVVGLYSCRRIAKAMRGFHCLSYIIAAPTHLWQGFSSSDDPFTYTPVTLNMEHYEEMFIVKFIQTHYHCKSTSYIIFYDKWASCLGSTKVLMIWSQCPEILG